MSSEREQKRKETLEQIAALTRLIENKSHPTSKTTTRYSSSRYQPYPSKYPSKPSSSSSQFKFSRNKTLVCVPSGKSEKTDESTVSSESSRNPSSSKSSYLQSGNKLVRVDSEAYQESLRKRSERPPQKPVEKRIKPSLHKKLVVIDGQTYTSSGNKLQNSALGPIPSAPSRAGKKRDNTEKNRMHVVRIGDVEFLVDPKRRKLVRKDSSADIKTTPSKIIMNGKQYVRSKRGNLVLKTMKGKTRTTSKNNKTWRRASLKSSKRSKKATKHCTFYRFGKCTKGSACRFTHDPKYVAPCTNILKTGECENPDCLLAHTILHETRPYCLHFERGRCFRDNCPYFHVKLAHDAGICSDFAWSGYCENGKGCTKKHFYMCPDFEATGSCPRTAKEGDSDAKKKCSLPHVPRYFDTGSSTTKKNKSQGKRQTESLADEDHVQVPMEPKDLEIFDDQEHDQDYFHGEEEADQESDDNEEEDDDDSESDNETDDEMIEDGEGIISFDIPDEYDEYHS